jgi:hypothetical protein
MAWRWGTGPVFAIEVRAAARRWQTFALRVLFIASLLLAFFVVWNAEVGGRGILRPYQMAVVGQSFYFGLIGTQISLLLLAAPAATAGAVCVDKARGTLLHLLVYCPYSVCCSADCRCWRAAFSWAASNLGPYLLRS